MRVNVYAEELTDRIELVTKVSEAGSFVGIRFYMELPVTVPITDGGNHRGYNTFRGPFMHKPGDDDSAAVTFWGKRDMRDILRKALAVLDEYYEKQSRPLPLDSVTRG